MELLEQAPENALGDEDRWHEKIMPIGLLEGVVLKPSLSAPGQSLRQEYSGEWSNDSQKPVRDASEELPKDGYSGEWSSPGWQKLGVTPTWASCIHFCRPLGSAGRPSHRAMSHEMRRKRCEIELSGTPFSGVRSSCSAQQNSLKLA